MLEKVKAELGAVGVVPVEVLLETATAVLATPFAPLASQAFIVKAWEPVDRGMLAEMLLVAPAEYAVEPST